MLVAPISRARAIELRTADSMTGPLVRRSRSSDTAWMTARAASVPAVVTMAPPERDGRLAHGRELDGIAAGALEGAADPGRHPQREIGRVHDRVDLQVADVPVPEFDGCQLTPPLGKGPQTDRAGRRMVHPG